MARQYRSRNRPRPPSRAGRQNLARSFLRAIPWKLLILVPILLLVAVPTYLYAAKAGAGMFPTITSYFSGALAPPPPPSPTPYPVFPVALPKVGSLHYAVQDGDSCDAILIFQMHMYSAGRVFSDLKPETVKALNTAMGHDCHAIQPGMVLNLSPQYPLVAFAGIVLKIDSATPQQVIPTPLIAVPTQQYTIDCSGGCMLTVRIANDVQVRLQVETNLDIRVGSWIWAQGLMARRSIRNFSDYPYADPNASLNGMTVRACDLQVEQTHDDNMPPCSQYMPNTIKDDGGAWLFGVTGPSSLDHWRYPLHLPAGTRVLLWLDDDNGNLKFQKGNPVYRYDEASQLYVKVA